MPNSLVSVFFLNDFLKELLNSVALKTVKGVFVAAFATEIISIEQKYGFRLEMTLAIKHC